MCAPIFSLALVLAAATPPVTPSPPPDRFDPAHDAWLLEQWQGPSVATGARDPSLGRNPPELRPRTWKVLDVGQADTSAIERFVVGHVVRTGGVAHSRADRGQTRV